MFLGNLLDEEGAIWFPLEFGTTFDAIRAVLFWVSVLYIAVGLILFFAIRGEGRKKFLRVGGIVTVIYTAALCLIFLILAFSEDGIKPILFYPL